MPWRSPIPEQIVHLSSARSTGALCRTIGSLEGAAGAGLGLRLLDSTEDLASSCYVPTYREAKCALSQSQFPVFTIYAQKSCLAVKPCERAWCIDRVQGHRLQGHARRTMSASSRQHCLELCLGERDFLCRTVKPIDGFTLLLIETSDPSGSCVATSASIGGTFTAQAFRIKEWIEGGGLKRPEISRWSRTEGETRHVNCTISVENGEKVKRRKGTNDYKANELSGERNERRELLDGTGVCMKNRSILGGILTQRHRNELFEGKDKGENGHSLGYENACLIKRRAPSGIGIAFFVATGFEKLYRCSTKQEEGLDEKCPPPLPEKSRGRNLLQGRVKED
ncbi:hypothetical protein HZH68_003267 [Vespula germanica]|uniref:Apple domain-containing protein n=1 Tax=Vespula germanica TaxID=30212 RepID=A0A834U352_VESGE|nr:hypothetical protein HZH68_003267 [Vespula germanica]